MTHTIIHRNPKNTLYSVETTDYVSSGGPQKSYEVVCISGEILWTSKDLQRALDYYLRSSLEFQETTHMSPQEFFGLGDS